MNSAFSAAASHFHIQDAIRSETRRSPTQFRFNAVMMMRTSSQFNREEKHVRASLRNTEMFPHIAGETPLTACGLLNIV